MAECADLPQRVARDYHIKYDWPASIDRDDLAQIGYIELWKLAKSRPADAADNFKGLVTTAMRRRIIDFRRDLLGRDKQKIAVTCTYDLNEVIHDGPALDVPGIDEFDDLRQAFQRVELTELEQRVVELILRGYRHGEIARELDTFGATITRAQQKIARKVGPILASMQ